MKRTRAFVNCISGSFMVFITFEALHSPSTGSGAVGDTWMVALVMAVVS